MPTHIKANVQLGAIKRDSYRMGEILSPGIHIVPYTKPGYHYGRLLVIESAIKGDLTAIYDGDLPGLSGLNRQFIPEGRYKEFGDPIELRPGDSEKWELASRDRVLGSLVITHTDGLFYNPMDPQLQLLLPPAVSPLNN